MTRMDSFCLVTIIEKSFWSTIKYRDKSFVLHSWKASCGLKTIVHMEQAKILLAFSFLVLYVNPIVESSRIRGGSCVCINYSDYYGNTRVDYMEDNCSPRFRPTYALLVIPLHPETGSPLVKVTCVCTCELDFRGGSPFWIIVAKIKYFSCLTSGTVTYGITKLMEFNWHLHKKSWEDSSNFVDIQTTHSLCLRLFWQIFYK